MAKTSGWRWKISDEVCALGREAQEHGILVGKGRGAAQRLAEKIQLAEGLALDDLGDFDIVAVLDVYDPHASLFHHVEIPGQGALDEHGLSLFYMNKFAVPRNRVQFIFPELPEKIDLSEQFYFIFVQCHGFLCISTGL